MTGPADSASTEIRVRYAETDAMGVVYYANYFVWFEIGRTDWIRGRGVTYREFEEQGVLLPVVEAHCAYRASARYDDLVRLETRLAALTPARVSFAYRATRAEPAGTGKRSWSRGAPTTSLTPPGASPAHPPPRALGAARRGLRGRGGGGLRWRSTAWPPSPSNSSTARPSRSTTGSAAPASSVSGRAGSAPRCASSATARRWSSAPAPATCCPSWPRTASGRSARALPANDPPRPPQARPRAGPPLVRGRSEALPFADDAFGAVVATFPSGYIFRPATWAEIARVLRPGGDLALVLGGELAPTAPAARCAPAPTASSTAAAPALAAAPRRAARPARGDR